MSAPKRKPAKVDSTQTGTVNCGWCCENDHRGIAGITLTCRACSDTGHKASCDARPS